MSGKCETCRWWDDKRDGAPTAKCFVFPQRIETNAQYFCGQWKFDPKETEEEKTKREERKKRIDKLVRDEEDRRRVATMKLWDRMMMKKDKA